MRYRLALTIVLVNHGNHVGFHTLANVIHVTHETYSDMSSRNHISICTYVFYYYYMNFIVGSIFVSNYCLGLGDGRDIDNSLTVCSIEWKHNRVTK